MKIKSPFIIIKLFILSSLFAQEHVHWNVVQKIREEGIHHSHIMEDVSWLTDVFGPRVSKSPSYFAAAKWVKGKLEAYGLENDSRTFHSNMDVFDKIVPEYLIQGAVVVASLVYHAAMLKEKIPRISDVQ